MKLKEITQYLEQIAPPGYQESYDNAGLITGNPEMEIHSALLCLDVTEEILQEAVQLGSNLIISHHPVIFKGIKKLTGSTETERIVILAIQHGIALYAAHTNLDNVPEGVNGKLADKLGLQHPRILEPLKGELAKLVVFVPESAAEAVREAIFEAGAGVIGNYDQCSFNLSGTGTFRGNEKANPFVGKPLLRHSEAEIRIETILPKLLKHSVIKAMLAAHPYEEVAWDLYPLENENPYLGAGIIGEIDESDALDFLHHIKQILKAGCIKHTRLTGKKIKRVAICGGSGSFLLKRAIQEKADLFLSADFKYHDFFEAEGKIIIVDAGHFETEQFTIELFYELLKKKFPTFACNLSKTGSNPVFYL